MGGTACARAERTWVAGHGGRALDNVPERRLVPRFFLELAEGGCLCVFVWSARAGGCVDETCWELCARGCEMGRPVLEKPRDKPMTCLSSGGRYCSRMSVERGKALVLDLRMAKMETAGNWR